MTLKNTEKEGIRRKVQPEKEKLAAPKAKKMSYQRARGSARKQY